MKCLFCGVELAPLRVVSNGMFCTDQHREAYDREQAYFANPRGPSNSLIPLDWWLFEPAAAISAAPPDPSQPVPFYPGPPQLPEIGAVESTIGMAWTEQLFPLAPGAPASMEFHANRHLAVPVDVVRKPHIPKWKGTPEPYGFPEVLYAPQDDVVPETDNAATEPAQASLELDQPAFEIDHTALETEAAQEVEEVVAAVEKRKRGTPQAFKWLAHTWKRSPTDLKLLTLLLPLIVFLAFSRTFPKVRIAPGSNIPNLPIQKVFSQGLGNFRQQLASRAAIDFTDDFRTGLDDWQGRGDTTAKWSYDASGFVRPAALALYRPTMGLADYRFEFLGEIDEKAMGWAFRAANPDNYYAVKFVITQPGPMPLVRLVRYAVVNGREERRQERPLPFLTRKDTMYRVLVDVRGSDFTIMSQGQVVDFWSDGRFKTGGVGLFCNRGERARVRWVEVSHQYDTLGKLCAYLAPYSGQGRSGSLN